MTPARGWDAVEAAMVVAMMRGNARGAKRPTGGRPLTKKHCLCTRGD